ncbi:MAG: lysostaphin resistance A-like protein [Haloferacaceae archaeon]
MSDAGPYRARLHAVGRAIAVALGVGLGALGVGLALVVAVALGARTAGLAPSPAVLLVVSLVLLQGLTFGGVALAYLRVRGRSVASVGLRVPTARDLVIAVAGYVLALGAAFGGALAVSLAGVEPARNAAAEIAVRRPSVLLLLVPASFLLIGPGEELLFRGVVQGRLREALSAPAAVGLASAVFAGVHFLALTGSSGARLVAIAVLFGPALVFGTAYELTDNLVVPALIHGAYNATLFTLLYVSLRFAGGPTGGPPGV